MEKIVKINVFKWFVEKIEINELVQDLIQNPEQNQPDQYRNHHVQIHNDLLSSLLNFIIHEEDLSCQEKGE